MPATEKEVKIASILYFQAYDEELPVRKYSRQDIDYIVSQVHQKLQNSEYEGLQPSLVH